MQVQWYGQSAFRLSSRSGTVFIDPFGDLSALTGRGIEFNYPPIDNLSADLLLITHEHADHNAAQVISGEPAVLRSTAGRLDSPLGQVLAVASEHDQRAGTERGPNTIFAFELDGVRVCHFGDFGQSHLREEQQQALGSAELLFLPVGGGPTIGAEQAATIAARLTARWIVPMHYRTPRIGFLEPADQFLQRMPAVHRLHQPLFDTSHLPAADGPLVVLPAVP